MTTTAPVGHALRPSLIAGLMGPVLIVLVLVLAASNVATVLNASFHDMLFGVMERAARMAGTELAEKVLQRSIRRTAEEATRRAVAGLADENRTLATKSKQLALEHADLTTRHTRVLAETNARKGAHAKTSAELDSAKVRRAAEAKHAKAMAGSVRKRLAKGVVRNVAGIPAEAVPYLGIGVTLAVTALDLHDACETMKEINELMKLLGQSEEQADVCGVKVPSVDEALKMMGTQWRTSAELVAQEATQSKLKVRVLEVRLPTANEAKSVVCPLIKGQAWIAC